MRAEREGADPLYGMCTAVIPVRIISSTPARCCEVPGPAEEKLSFPGIDFARATSSFALATGRVVGTSRRFGLSENIDTGAKSRSVSKDSLEYSDMLIASAGEVSSTVKPSGGALAASPLAMFV